MTLEWGRTRYEYQPPSFSKSGNPLEAQPPIYSVTQDERHASFTWQEEGSRWHNIKFLVRGRCWRNVSGRFIDFLMKILNTKGQPTKERKDKRGLQNGRKPCWGLNVTHGENMCWFPMALPQCAVNHQPSVPSALSENYHLASEFMFWWIWQSLAKLMAFHVLLSLQSEKTLIEIIAGKKR